MDYYYLYLNEKLTDFTIIEKTDHDTIEHKIHRLIVYGQSDFLHYIIDQDVNTVTITTPVKGLLELIIKAIYNRDTALSIYDKYISESTADNAMHLFDICNYLQLITHIEYVSTSIENHIDIDDLLNIFASRIKQGLLIQDEILNILKKGIMDEYMVKVRDIFYIQNNFINHPHFPLIQHLLPS